jgi:hypothetical protein
VDRVSTLATKDTTTDYIARRWLHTLPPDLPAAAVVTLRPYWHWRGVNFATHGSPHDSDAQVPIIFYGAGIKPGAIQDERSSSTSLTLASIVGVRPMEHLDGHVLREAIKPDENAVQAADVPGARTLRPTSHAECPGQHAHRRGIRGARGSLAQIEAGGAEW